MDMDFSKETEKVSQAMTHIIQAHEIFDTMNDEEQKRFWILINTSSEPKKKVEENDKS